MDNVESEFGANKAKGWSFMENSKPCIPAKIAASSRYDKKNLPGVKS